MKVEIVVCKLSLGGSWSKICRFGKDKPITRRQILDSSKLKEFANDNFKFDENGRKLSKRLENTVGIGEIARYEQFLLFPQCFQKACFPGASKGVRVPCQSEVKRVRDTLEARGLLIIIFFSWECFLARHFRVLA